MITPLLILALILFLGLYLLELARCKNLKEMIDVYESLLNAHKQRGDLQREIIDEQDKTIKNLKSTIETLKETVTRLKTYSNIG